MNTSLSRLSLAPIPDCAPDIQRSGSGSTVSDTLYN